MMSNISFAIKFRKNTLDQLKKRSKERWNKRDMTSKL